MNDDERRALIRRWLWEHWGRGPSQASFDRYVPMLREQGFDATLAAITDHDNAAAFRDKRGW